MKQYEELLKTQDGRGELQDLLGARIRQVQRPVVVNEVMAIPVDRVVSCANHRYQDPSVQHPATQAPIEVGETWIGSRVYYVVADGNHRAEAARARGDETIQALVLQRTKLQEKAVQSIDQGLER